MWKRKRCNNRDILIFLDIAGVLNTTNSFNARYEICDESVHWKLALVKLTIWDKTPIYKEKTRDVEIRRYLREYELKNSDFTYVILDDDISIFDDKELKIMNLYKVNQHTRLTEKDIDKVLQPAVAKKNHEIGGKTPSAFVQ